MYAFFGSVHSDTGQAKYLGRDKRMDSYGWMDGWMDGGKEVSLMSFGRIRKK